VKLVASLIVKNELYRLLKLCVASLTEFCDEIRVLDDGSDDGTYEWLVSGDQVRRGVSAISNDGLAWIEHEGRARQRLLEWTLGAEPTHILAIDADEFVADGRVLRAALDEDDAQEVWTLAMQEVWKADEERLWIREDGGWRTHEVPVLYRVPEARGSEWRILDRELACGREPLAVRSRMGQRLARTTGTEILHFGWTDESGRRERYERYVVRDGGNFHAQAHLRSIMWEDRQVRMGRRKWPAALDVHKEEILRRTNGAR